MIQTRCVCGNNCMTKNDKKETMHQREHREIILEPT